MSGSILQTALGCHVSTGLLKVQLKLAAVVMTLTAGYWTRREGVWRWRAHCYSRVQFLARDVTPLAYFNCLVMGHLQLCSSPLL